jgi:hypothetical protein
VRGQYRLSVPVIYFDITPWFERDLALHHNNLNLTLGPWTVDHSKSGRLNAYRSKDNKVYQFRNNKQNEVSKWDVYTSHGSQLRLVETVPLDRFNLSDGTPIQIKSLANGTIYGNMTSIVKTDTKSKTCYGPDVSWDKFIQSQPRWVESLLQDVHFFLDDGYSNLWEIVYKLEENGYLLAVSDGSVKFHDMTFWWILATPTGKRLAAAARPCNGRGNS